jgi:hypothetical protein
MHNLSTLLDQPEYLHVTLNHFPSIGLIVAILVLGIGLAARNRGVTLAGLALVVLLCLSVWPVYHYGEAGYDRVLSMSDEAGGAYLDYHKALAERWVFLYFVTAAVAALGLLSAWRARRWLTLCSTLTLILEIASLVAGMFISEVGGEIRHREFRRGPLPAKPSSARARLPGPGSARLTIQDSRRSAKLDSAAA